MTKLWIISTDSETGIELHHFLSEAARDEWALGWVSLRWNAHKCSRNIMPVQWNLAYEALSMCLDMDQMTCHQPIELSVEHLAGTVRQHQGDGQDVLPNPIIEAHGYKLSRVSEFMVEASQEHVARFNQDCAPYGKFVLWDPHGNGDDFMLASDSIAKLNEEFRSRSDWPQQLSEMPHHNQIHHL